MKNAIERHTVYVYGQWEYVYKLDEGYDESKWNEYWSEKRMIFWRAIKPKRHGYCWELLGCGDAIYLHPMNFSAILHGSGISSKGEENGYPSLYEELRELNKVCKEVGELYGSKFELFATDEQIIDFGELKLFDK